MSKATKAEEKVLAQLDEYLSRCEQPPPGIHIFQKQADSVVRSRRRHNEPRHTDDYLNFKTYKGINIIVLGDSENDEEATQS